MKRIIAGAYRSGIADDPPRIGRIGPSIVTDATRKVDTTPTDVFGFEINCLQIGLRWSEFVTGRIEAVLEEPLWAEQPGTVY